MGLFGELLGIVGATGDLITARRVERKIRTGTLDPVMLLPYRGHGTAERLWLRGRVLEERRVTLGSASDPWWRNLVNTVRRFNGLEIPGAVLRARVDGHALELVTDREGFFKLDVANPEPDAYGWRPVPLELVGPAAAGQPEVCETGLVLVPPPGAQFGVISDLDDTVIRTGLTEALTAARIVLLDNASTRLPFPGVAAFYRALREGTDPGPSNPLFYVSGSPWNLYDLLHEFLQMQGVPAGPMFLKDWGIDEDKFIREKTRVYKRERIEGLFAAYPHIDFVLIGDSGQEDPEIYRDIVFDFPGRVVAVYIRDVTVPSRDEQVHDIADEVSAKGVPMILAEDTLPVAEHAADLGLIARGALADIRSERERDR